MFVRGQGEGEDWGLSQAALEGFYHTMEELVGDDPGNSERSHASEETHVGQRREVREPCCREDDERRQQHELGGVEPDRVPEQQLQVVAWIEHIRQQESGLPPDEYRTRGAARGPHWDPEGQLVHLRG